jgi:hypothetical protein
MVFGRHCAAKSHGASIKPPADRDEPQGQQFSPTDSALAGFRK